MENLGLIVNTRRMIVIFPEDKRRELLQIIDTEWTSAANLSINSSAAILGHLRTAAALQPLGAYFSIRIQQ